MKNEELQSILFEAEKAKVVGNYDDAERLANYIVSKNSQEQEEDIHELQSSAYLLLGEVNRLRGNYTSALEHYTIASKINQNLNNKDGIARALNGLGTVYMLLSDSTTALEYFNKSFAINEELNNQKGIAGNLHNIGVIHFNLSDYAKALEFYLKALEVNRAIDNKSWIAYNLGNIGTVYYRLSAFKQSLEYQEKALEIKVELGDTQAIALSLTHIGIVYVSLSDHAYALTYFQKALAIVEEIGSKEGIAGNLTCIGNVYLSLSDFARAFTYFQKALSIYEEIGNINDSAINLGNIGVVYLNLSDYTNALTFFQKALAINESTGRKDGIAFNLERIGSMYAHQKFEGFDPQKAHEFLQKAMAIDLEIGNKLSLYNVHKCLANLYEVEKRWEEAFEHFKKYHEIKEEVQSEEAKNSANLMEQRRQAAEREKEIQITKATADAKHQATEQLLHNVLPQSIANKMIDGTKLIAEKIPSVSVMFADIVNFTKLSQHITPEELVEGLDRIFSTFDALAEKHGLEKIKTIGDAYMVVSGAPIQREDHAEAMAHFALEMVEAMKEFRSISTGEEIQLRIGIHSGEVVAGVIGKKKFAYDLWGDAVNTASRMESHGEAGKIHVSEEFKHAVETLHATSLQFNRRGEMEIKGKGKMRTYFLEKYIAIHEQTLIEKST